MGYLGQFWIVGEIPDFWVNFGFRGGFLDCLRNVGFWENFNFLEKFQSKYLTKHQPAVTYEVGRDDLDHLFTQRVQGVKGPKTLQTPSSTKYLERKHSWEHSREHSREYSESTQRTCRSAPRSLGRKKRYITVVAPVEQRILYQWSLQPKKSC